jgi:hypothetical protein
MVVADISDSVDAKKLAAPSMLTKTAHCSLMNRRDVSEGNCCIT